MCFGGEKITRKRLGEPGNSLSNQRDLSTPSALQWMKVDISYSAFVKIEARWTISSSGPPKENTSQGNGREPLSVTFLCKELPQNECFFFVEDIELHMGSPRSWVTLFWRLYSLGSYSQETNRGLLLIEFLKG